MASPEGTEQLLQRVQPTLNVPPMIAQPGVHKIQSPTAIPEDTVPPPADFTRCRYDAQKRKFPQCISHRGYKAAFPENTMASFKGAVAVGTHALETDVHTTKDEVVVISHDEDLKRCFGRDEKIAESNWDDIKDARTLREPREPLPRLETLLEYLAQPGMEEMWLLLDIKLSNDAERIMRCLSHAIASVSPSAKKAWKDRIVLGIWAAKFLPHAVECLPGFPITHIGFSLSYARNFLTVPNVSFNMLFPVLLAPGGKTFLREAREQHNRPVYTWTVNEREKMEWCIRRKLDGVITDDPKKFLQVCDEFDELEKEPWPPIGWRALYDVLRVWVWVHVAMVWFFRKKLGPVASREMIRKVPTK